MYPALQQKRETFRKQIRRQQLQQKFKKIRDNFQTKYQSVHQQQKLKLQIEQAIRQIQQKDYFELVNEGNYQSDSSAYNQVKQLLSMQEQHLTYPDHNTYQILLLPNIQQQILRRWQAIYKWEQQNGEQVQKIIKTIGNTMCCHSFNDVVVDFLLRTVDFLIYGNKVIQMKRIALKENEVKYLVGQPEKYYRQMFRFTCRNILMNLTAPDDDELLLPFIGQISQVIKQSSYFAHAYHNLFLTQDLPLKQKIQLYNSFLTLIQQVPSCLHDGDISYPTIFYIILSNKPLATKIGIKQPYNSLELNYRCLKILDNYLGEAKIVIDAYSTCPHEEKYQSVVMFVADVIELLCREEECVLGKVPDMLNVLEFMLGRIRAGKSIPQVKCKRTILQALTHISRYPTIYSELCLSKAILPLQIQRLFDKLWKQLFYQTPSNISRLQQKTQHLFQPQQQQQYHEQTYSQLTNQNQFFSEQADLQLDCIILIAKIYKFSDSLETKAWRLLQSQTIEKMMVTCSEQMRGEGSPKLKILKDESLELLCLCVIGFVKSSSELVDQMSSFRIDDILLGQFFFSSPQQHHYSLFAFIAYELNQLTQAPQSSGLLVTEVILPTLHELILRLSFQIESIVQEYSYERSNFSPQQWGDFIQKDRWAVIYREFREVHQIPNLLERLFNSKHKVVENNQRTTNLINDVLKLTDTIKSFVSSSGQGQNLMIELQK